MLQQHFACLVAACMKNSSGGMCGFLAEQGEASGIGVERQALGHQFFDQALAFLHHHDDPLRIGMVRRSGKCISGM